MKISDVRAIVTGAASGMGRCFALALAREGAQVVAADVNQEGLDETSALAADLSGTVHTTLCNVADEASVEAMFVSAIESMGSVNVVVNNAGIFRDALLVRKDRKTGEIKRMSLSDWQKVIDVDLTGPFLCTRAFATHCIESDHGGVVVNISSVSRHGNRGQSNYSAAKAGLVADTKLWAEELARYGVRVGAIAPGFVRTPILEGMPERMLEKMLSAVPLRRAGEPEEIYQGVKFIIECDYFTGRVLDIDGGVQV